MDLLSNITGLISVILSFTFGIYLSIKTTFFQLKGLKNAFKTVLAELRPKRRSDCTVSSKGAMCTALAATIGTGNIVGVSGAIALCGAGVVFWIAVSSFFAMIIKYVEIYVTVSHKKLQSGELVGGTMYAVRYALPKRFGILGSSFALLTVLASFGTGNLIQINTSVAAIKGLFPKSFDYSGTAAVLFSAVSAILIGFLLLSGVGAVSRVCEKTIPFMLAVYTVASFFIIIINYDRLFEICGMILKGAFKPSAVTGGAVTSLIMTVKTGIVRGIVSNEAGMGSATIAHSMTSDSAKSQGELGIAEVFIDTAVCLLTAFVILLGNTDIVYGIDTGLLSVTEAFYNTFGGISSVVLGVFLVFFGISSVLGWGAYGTVCAEFLWNKKGGYVYKMVFSAICMLGAVISVDKIWSLSEILNSLVSIPNIIAVFMLFSKNRAIHKTKLLSENYRQSLLPF